VIPAFFSAMNEQDAEAATSLARPDVVIALGPDEIVGHDGLRRLASQRDDQLTFEWLPLRVLDESDQRVSVDARRVQRWRATGEVASEDELVALFTLDETGKIARIEIG